MAFSGDHFERGVKEGQTEDRWEIHWEAVLVINSTVYPWPWLRGWQWDMDNGPQP